MVEERVELRGHIIDSLLLPKVLDRIVASGAGYELECLDIGARRSDPSHACIRLRTETRNAMDELLSALKIHGAVATDTEDARLAAADIDGAFPEGFYATTNLPTQVRLNGEWLDVEDREMDRGVVVNVAANKAVCTPMHRVRKGDMVVVGHRGVRVVPLERKTAGQPFEFMGSGISSEKPKPALVNQVARELQRCRQEHEKTVFVGGPAIIHTGAAESLAWLIDEGYVGVLLTGNGLAAHDIENALYGTSLGVNLKDGTLAPGGHRNHIRAINAVRRLGSIEAAVKSGLITTGVMHACITKGVSFVLAGSIRDDGPLPEVITDTIEAADAIRRHVKGACLILVVASTLHAVAVGNVLPAETRMIVVDISQAALTKLSDRGSWQTAGIVSDAGLFLRELVETLQRGVET